MNAKIQHITQAVRWTFWRLAAYLTGWAVRHQAWVSRAMRLAPVAAVAVFAFALGRLVGLLLGGAI